MSMLFLAALLTYHVWLVSLDISTQTYKEPRFLINQSMKYSYLKRSSDGAS